MAFPPAPPTPTTTMRGANSLICPCSVGSAFATGGGSIPGMGAEIMDFATFVYRGFFVFTTVVLVVLLLLLFIDGDVDDGGDEGEDDTDDDSEDEFFVVSGGEGVDDAIQRTEDDSFNIEDGRILPDRMERPYILKSVVLF